MFTAEIKDVPAKVELCEMIQLFTGAEIKVLQQV